MDLNAVWYMLIAVLLGVYAALDGFDLGVGILHLFARDEAERRTHINSIAPVWDGNEVWLLTGGGALFAAFPMAYATVFSGFYLALVLVLVALIARAVSLEFRGKVESAGWKRLWDWCFGLGSLLPAALFGVAAGNLVRGIPLDAGGNYAGTFFGLLNPYSLLVGATTLSMCVMHGAAWLALKTRGGLQARSAANLRRAWLAFAVLYASTAAATWYTVPDTLGGALRNPLSWALLAAFVACLALTPVMSSKGRNLGAFLSSGTGILCVTGLAAVGLFPRIVPASNDPALSLTIHNASSTPYTLMVMLVIALVGVPLVIWYTAFIYRAFRGEVTPADDGY